MASRVRCCFLAAALACAGGAPVCAQDAADAIDRSSAATSDQPAVDINVSVATSLGPAGDPGGYRAFLAARGITYDVIYIAEGLGNVSGGLRRAAIYQGRLDTELEIDLGRLAGWSGATFHTNLYQIHGRGLSNAALGNILVTSGLEALPATRLFELWLEQTAFDGRLGLRVGQLAADTEFVTSQYAGLFVNSTFGWPGILATALPGGGPAYPLATPGLRVKYAPNDRVTMLAGVFNGAPAGYPAGDAQRNDHGGLEFRLSDPAFAIGEIAFGTEKAASLPGVLKLGGWYHLARFDDLRDGVAPDGTRVPLAEPAAIGVPRRLTGNGGAYAVVDQLLYRETPDGTQGLGAFARVSAAPGDRNLVGLYVDGGFTYKGLIAGRPNDTIGASFGYARLSGAARGFDRDARSASLGAGGPVRSSEAVLEATYQAEIVSGWTVQPDLQYVIRPGGGVADPRGATGGAVKNATVIGLRTAIRY